MKMILKSGDVEELLEEEEEEEGIHRGRRSSDEKVKSAMRKCSRAFTQG
jgi:hypothetical protein